MIQLISVWDFIVLISSLQGQMGVTPAAFAHLTHKVMSLAQGRVAVILEVTSVILFSEWHLQLLYMFMCFMFRSVLFGYICIHVHITGGILFEISNWISSHDPQNIAWWPMSQNSSVTGTMWQVQVWYTQILQDYIIKTAYYSIFSQLLFIVNFGVAEVWIFCVNIWLGSVTESILNVIKVLRPHWKCLQYQGFTSDPCPYEEVNQLPPK